MTHTPLSMLVGEFLSSNTVRLDTPDGAIRINQYRTLIRLMEGVSDPRVKGRTTYTIGKLLGMAFIAMMSGADTYCEMSYFWNAKRDLCLRVFDCEAVPSHDTFRRVIGLVKSEDFNAVTVECVLKATVALCKALGLKQKGKKLLSVDGKQLCGTGREATDKGRIKDVQILNFYDCGTDTCIYSEEIESKTNEIPHAQKILKTMNLKDTVVTFDALHMQKATIDVIAEGHGDFVGGLKGNQPKLNEWAKGIFTEELMESIRKDGNAYSETCEIARDKREDRRYYLYPLTEKERSRAFAGWKKVRAVVCFESETCHNVTGHTTSETRYYVTSLKDVKDAAKCIRGHWCIEDCLHHGLDTVMLEDAMTVSNRAAALNRSIMNKMCLAVFRRLQSLLDPKERPSKKTLRKCMSWNFDKWMKFFLISMDPESLRKCLVVEPKAKAESGK